MGYIHCNPGQGMMDTYILFQASFNQNATEIHKIVCVCKINQITK